MVEDLEKKVEDAMPTEDGEDAERQQTSFVKAEEEKKGPSMGEIFLYIAKKLKDIDEKLGVIIKQEPKKASKPQKKKAIPKPATPEAPAKVANAKIEDVKMMFPEDLENLLAFSEKEGFIILKPRQFLGSDNFAKIGAIVRGIGGEYVSAGKDSHFRVAASKLGEAKPAEKPQPQPQPQPQIEGEPPRLVEIKKALGSFLELVSIDVTTSATMYKIKPRQFLGGDNFGKIIAIVRNLGGNYVSQGKESHFNIPKNA